MHCSLKNVTLSIQRSLLSNSRPVIPHCLQSISALHSFHRHQALRPFCNFFHTTAPRNNMSNISQYKQYTFDPPVEVLLPPSLTQQEFNKLLTSPSNPTAAYTFPALDNWLEKLLHNFHLQRNEAHPFHKHPYRLRMLEVQAVDWFRHDESGYDNKLGFMKIKAKIETDPYIHDDEAKERSDWIPGAVFLRGGSVAVLVRTPIKRC